MKKLTLLLALALVLSLAACGGGTRPDTGDVGGVEPSANVSGGDVSAAPEATPEPVEPSAPVGLALPGATLAAGYDNTVGLLPDGSAVVAGNAPSYRDVQYAVAVAASRNCVIGLHISGVPLVFGDSFDMVEMNSWRVVAISAGYSHVLGLCPDGTVVANGANRYGDCDVGSWTDVTSVAAGYTHSVGLHSDGTVVAVGQNGNGQCDVGGWADIAAVSAGNDHTVGLKSDGTVVAVGYNEYGQCDVEDWTDIVAIAAGGAHTLGLRSDGTVVAVGSNEYGQCDVDGWTDIVAIAASYGHSVGLRSDGTVVAVGWNEYGQCDVDGWVLRVPEQ